MINLDLVSCQPHFGTALVVSFFNLAENKLFVSHSGQEPCQPHVSGGRYSFDREWHCWLSWPGHCHQKGRLDGAPLILLIIKGNCDAHDLSGSTMVLVHTNYNHESVINKINQHTHTDSPLHTHTHTHTHIQSVICTQCFHREENIPEG